MPPREDVLSDLAARCTGNPSECLDLIVRTIQEPSAPSLVAAIGNGLLENLLNESSAILADDVAAHLRTNRRFRQAFSFGNYSSVDPAIIADWARVFQDLGTTKSAERKSLYSRGA